MAVERGGRRLAATIATVMLVAHSGFPAGAEGVARFRGRVLGADGATPRPGITISLVEEGGEKVGQGRLQCIRDRRSC